MAEENKAFENVDLGMFQEASEYLLEKETQDVTYPVVEPEEKVEVKNEEIDPVTGLPKVEKPEEESEEGKKDNENEPSSQDTEKDSSRLTPYFKLLVEEGEFSEEDLNTWDGTTAGMIELRNQKNQERWEQYKNETLDPRTKWLQDNLEAGIPFEDLVKMDKQTLTYESFTEESLTGEDNIENQRNAARLYFKKTTRFSDEGIERTIKRLEDSGELEAESKAFSQELKSIDTQEKAQALENAKEQQKLAEKAQQEALINFKQTLDKTEEVIPGLKVNNLMRDKIYNTLTTAVSEDEQGIPMNKIAEARAKDPFNFEIKLAYLFELTNGFTDFGPLTIGGKKKAYAEFEEQANKIDKHSSSTIVKNPTDNQFLDEIEQLYNKGTFGRY